MTCTSFPCDADGGPAFCGQDAQYGWDTTHESTERFTRDLSMSGAPVVVDNVTGLMWQGCAQGFTGNNCATSSATTSDWATALANCDNLSWGGYTDWRLPDHFELHSIMDAGTCFPSIDTNAFPATSSTYFWSSSTVANDTSWAWFATLAWGGIYDDAIKSDLLNSRCVRGEPAPQPTRFVRDTSVAGYPTVTDNTTSLEWQGCARGLSGDSCEAGSATTLSWSDALSYCEALSWSGHDDWRLPDKEEAFSIIDLRTFNPSVETVAFPATPVGDFWSSSSAVNQLDLAWSAFFTVGIVGGHYRNEPYYVRCVRGGP
jgi:hypothetical protein